MYGLEYTDNHGIALNEPCKSGDFKYISFKLNQAQAEKRGGLHNLHVNTYFFN